MTSTVVIDTASDMHSTPSIAGTKTQKIMYNNSMGLYGFVKLLLQNPVQDEMGIVATVLIFGVPTESLYGLLGEGRL